MYKREMFGTVSLVMASMVSAGCGVEDAESDDTAVSVDELGSAATEQTLLPHGGGGGTYTGHATPNAVIYALQVNSGLAVDRITFFYYQPTSPDNRYANEPLQTITFGGRGGRANATFECPTNQGIVGLRGASGTVLDRIGVVCGDVTNPDPFSGVNTFSPLWGGGGGSFFDDRCSTGKLMDSFNVRSGALIDMLQAICIDAR